MLKKTAIIENSLLAAILKKRVRALKTYSGSSSLCMVIGGNGAVLALDDSVLIGYGMGMYNLVKKYIRECLATSNVFTAMKRARNSLSLNPVRNLGLIILIATMTNITVSLILAKESGALSWFMRAVFIVAGTVWALSDIDLNEAKKTSLWLRLVKEKL